MANKLRAMIVENDETIRGNEAIFFKKKGFEVATAGSAEEARKKLDGKKFNLFLVDKNLEGASYGGSMELIELIQKTNPNSYLALITGEAGPGRATEVILIKKDPTAFNALERLVEKVKEKPFRKKPMKTKGLKKGLERPLIVKEASGRLNLFTIIEGDPEPLKALELIVQGGRVLTLKEALDDPLCRRPLREKLLEHQRIIGKFIKENIKRTGRNSARKSRPKRRRPH